MPLHTISSLSFRPCFPGGCITTYLYWWEPQPFGVHAHEVLPHPQRIHVVEVMRCSASLLPPKQWPVLVVCLGDPGLALQNHPPTVPKESPARLGEKACLRASWGATERTERSGRTVMPATGACPRTASACGSPGGQEGLRRGHHVPGSQKESDRSVEAGRTRHRPSRTEGGHRCQ